MAAPARRIDPLTSLRFFAAAMIVWLHVGGSFGIPHVTSFALGSGVSIFFVLSGFILTYRYPVLPGRRETTMYLASRIGRVWPAYMAGIFFELAVSPLGDLIFQNPQHTLRYIGIFLRSEYAPNFAINTAMVQTWVPWTWWATSLNQPSWSVSTEFFFYLMFPFLIWNFERTWWWKLVLAAALGLAMVAIATALNVDYASGNIAGVQLIYQHPLARLIEFAAGMVAALVWRKTAHVRLSFGAASALEILALLLIVFTVYRTGNEAIGTQLGRWYYSGTDIALPGALLILVLAHQQGAISKALSLRPLVWLGEISYAIFLLHFPIGRVVSNLAKQHPDMPPWQWGVIYVVAVLAASTLVYLIVERPLRRAIVSAAAWFLRRRGREAA